MIYKILKNWHYSIPPRLGVWRNRSRFSWHVKFTDSCRYDLRTEDQLDINKLVGIGYLPGGHHKNSARFGWQYDIDKGQIELLAYCYYNGIRSIRKLCYCEIGKAYTINLLITSTAYLFNVTIRGDDVPLGETSVLKTHSHKLQYLLNPYFGGNLVAPHCIKIELEAC